MSGFIIPGLYCIAQAVVLLYIVDYPVSENFEGVNIAAESGCRG